MKKTPRKVKPMMSAPIELVEVEEEDETLEEEEDSSKDSLTTPSGANPKLHGESSASKDDADGPGNSEASTSRKSSLIESLKDHKSTWGKSTPPNAIGSTFPPKKRGSIFRRRQSMSEDSEDDQQGMSEASSSRKSSLVESLRDHKSTWGKSRPPSSMASKRLSIAPGGKRGSIFQRKQSVLSSRESTFGSKNFGEGSSKNEVNTLPDSNNKRSGEFIPSENDEDDQPGKSEAGSGRKSSLIESLRDHKSAWSKPRPASSMAMQRLSTVPGGKRSSIFQKKQSISSSRGSVFGSNTSLFDPRRRYSRRASQFSTMGRRVSMSAKNFLSGEEDDKQQRDRVKARRMSHLHKFGGSMQQKLTPDEVEEDGVAAAAPCPPRRTASSVHHNQMRSLGRRESAAVVLIKAGVNKLKTKPVLKSTWEVYGGRTFLRSDWEEEEEDGSEALLVDEELNFIDEDFFTFRDRYSMRDELEPLKKDDKNRIKEISAAAAPQKPKELFQHGRRVLAVKPKKKKRYRNLFRSLLQGTMKKDVSKKIEHQFDERRQYFSVWLSVVQILIMTVVLCTFDFAPIGLDTAEVRQPILLSRDGVLYEENLRIHRVQSFWFGPSMDSLILLGAKYAPCMRYDRKVFHEIIKERIAENSTGCCMARLSDGCIQRAERDCMTPAVKFVEGSVCGQDPRACTAASIDTNEWGNSIMDWPKCDRVAEQKQIDRDLKHMTCRVVGRPCCVKTQGQCVITTRDNCDFRRGVYHPEHTLCSQVDCLAATCGNNFYSRDAPDQFYRLFISLFLCAGVLHLVVMLIFNATILRDIEGYAGWLRTSLIFLGSGIGGNLWSAVLLPYQADVGESGGMFGIFACIMVEGIQNWSNLASPCRYLSKLIAILVFVLLFGLLPMVDNFAHIFGFVYGILLGFVFLPPIVTVDEEEDPDGFLHETQRNIFVRVLCLLAVVALTTTGFFLFFRFQDFHSSAIAVFNCPFGDSFCQNFHQGQQIESRIIEY